MMAALALIRITEGRRLPAIPLPLFVLWPFVPVCLGLAVLLDRAQQGQGAKLRMAMQVFRNMRGLTIDIDTADDKHIHIRFV
jgi:hypothetical protein